MRGFLVVDEGYPIICDHIATQVQQWARSLGYTCTADWYYDEFVEGPTEYGVKIDVLGATVEQSITQLRMLWRLSVELFSDFEIRLEIPRQ